MTLDVALPLAQQCDHALKLARKQKMAEDDLRREPPLVRLWNAEWELKHVCSVEYSAQFSWISNDTGPGQLVLPMDSPIAEWIHDHQGRIDRGEGRNIGITIDYCGSRWSGMLDKYTVESRDDGDQALVVDFTHDYEKLKWVQCWSNPWLPAAIQAPRAFIAAGPVGWVLKLALLVNLWRIQSNRFITWPDDPLDPAEWLKNPFDLHDWSIVVKPESFLDAMGSGQIWHVFISRWETWHDAAHAALEDAEMSVVCRRYLPGDDEPWPGAAQQLRHGTLVVDIVDKSGVFIGTANGGTLADGLIRTVAEFGEDFIESTINIAADVETPQDYWKIGHKYTDKALPYVVFQEGDTSPIETSKWINSPAKGVQINVGGHSMPGVNETIDATIQMVGDLIGNIAMIGSLGGSISALTRPLWEDTILAWSSTKLHQRAQNTGFERLHEYFQQGGANQAYTTASLLMIRAGVWATKTTFTWEVSVADGLPFMVGDNGLGHFFLDDRIGLVLKGDTAIHMDRARKITLAWSDENPPEWQIAVGDERNYMDPAQRALGRIETLIAGLRNLGVY